MPEHRSVTTMRVARTAAAAGCAAALFAVLAACTSSGSPSAPPGGSGASTGPAIPVSVSANVATYLAEPKLPLKPLATKPPTGKRIAVLYNSTIPAGISAAKIMSTAAAVLGWTTTEVADNGSPESFISAFDRAMSMNPDVIDIGGGTEPSTFASELAKANAKGIAVMGDSVTAPPTALGGGGLQIVANGPAFYSAIGKAAADWMIADSHGTADVALFTLQGFAILKGLDTAMENEFKAECPGCKVTAVPLTSASIGTTAPSTVVSKLQSDPHISYAWFDIGDLTRGVQAAISGAGVHTPKLATGVPIDENFASMRQGKWSMIVNQSDVLSWYKIDGAARFLETKRPVASECATRIFTPSNVPAGSGRPLTPTDYAKEFAALWHAS